MFDEACRMLKNSGFDWSSAHSVCGRIENSTGFDGRAKEVPRFQPQIGEQYSPGASRRENGD
jgi:hypothetical protein